MKNAHRFRNTVAAFCVSVQIVTPSPGHAYLEPTTVVATVSSLAEVASTINLVIALYRLGDSVFGGPNEATQILSKLDELSQLQSSTISALSELNQVTRDAVRQEFLADDIAELKDISRILAQFSELGSIEQSELEVLASRANRLTLKLSKHSNDLQAFQPFVLASSLQLVLHRELRSPKNVLERLTQTQLEVLTKYSTQIIPPRLEAIKTEIPRHEQVASQRLDFNLAEYVRSISETSGYAYRYVAYYDGYDPDTREPSFRFAKEAVRVKDSSGRVTKKYYGDWCDDWAYTKPESSYPVRMREIGRSKYTDCDSATSYSVESYARQKYDVYVAAVEEHLNSYFDLSDEKLILENMFTISEELIENLSGVTGAKS